MEHISTLNTGVFTSMVKRLGMTDIGRNYAHRFILENIPSLSVTARRFIDGVVAEKLEAGIWEYSDIAKAIDAAKTFIG